MSDFYFFCPFCFIPHILSALIMLTVVVWPLFLLHGTARFRREWRLGLLIMLLLPTSVQAFEWRDLWLRTDQQAAVELSQGQADVAAQLFIDPAWRGMALYQAGDYIGAAEAFSQSQDINAGYNLGNAFAKAGQLEQAVLTYREVLRENPEHADARANLTLIEELLQQQLDQANGDAQNEQPLQEPLPSENDNSQPKPEDHEDAEESGSNTENSETNVTQQLVQNDNNDGSESNRQEIGSSGDEMLPSDQIQQANNREAIHEDVSGQGQLQDQSVEDQMSQGQPTEDKDQIQSVENIDDAIVLPSDQTQQADDMEAAREDVMAQVQQQEQPLDDQMSAEQKVREKDQTRPEKDESDIVHQDVGEERQQQNQATEMQKAIEQPSDEMDESLFIDRTYAEAELTPDQWLRLIPDDPSGLLRRKFMLEHLRRQQNSQ